MTTRAPGRPNKLQQIAQPASTKGPAKTIEQVILETLEMVGGSTTAAAMAAGVCRATITSWEDKGRDARQRQQDGRPLTRADRQYLAFLDASEEARAKCAMANRIELLRPIRRTVTTTRSVAGKVTEIVETVTEEPDRQSLRWLLARTDPEFRDRMELTGADGGPIEVAPVPPRDETLRQLERLHGELAGRKLRALPSGGA